MHFVNTAASNALKELNSKGTLPESKWEDIWRRVLTGTTMTSQHNKDNATSNFWFCLSVYLNQSAERPVSLPDLRDTIGDYVPNGLARWMLKAKPEQLDEAFSHYRIVSDKFLYASSPYFSPLTFSPLWDDRSYALDLEYWWLEWCTGERASSPSQYNSYIAEMWIQTLGITDTLHLRDWLGNSNEGRTFISSTDNSNPIRAIVAMYRWLGSERYEMDEQTALLALEYAKQDLRRTAKINQVRGLPALIKREYPLFVKGLSDKLETLQIAQNLL